MRRNILSACVIACGLTVSACDTVSEYTDTINPFTKKEKILPGERQDLFSAGTTPAEIAGQTASVGPASGGQDWSQAGGNSTNNPGNVAVSVSGARAWRSSVGKSVGGGLGGISGVVSSPVRLSARPVSDGGRIYVYKQDGTVVALSASGGGRAWSRDLRPEGERDVASGGGVAVDNGRVFVATGYGQLAALDANSGTVLWSKDLSAPAREAPTAAAGHVFAVTQNNEVVALTQEDGTEKWAYAGIPETGGILSSANPAVSGGTVVFPSSSGEVLAMDIEKGQPMWIDGVSRSYRTHAVSGLVDVAGSPVIADGVVYAAGVAGRIIAASIKTGERVWEQDYGSVHTPVVSGDAVFLIDLDDNMLALSRKTGEPLWQTPLPSGKKKDRVNWAGPILANGTLVAFSSDGKMVRIDASSGRSIGTQETSIDVYVSPIVAGGRVVTVSSDGDVVAFN
ncbi:PQQ-binding-like beta-propeller repeat protein [Stappia sp. F7233]|uniref:PQQ-binding-like beta-propeller repeat protein n=1 Tax=Stappia albiluteola TaxID=2758565 RepID=A0A839ABM3_9HYPH|nr:PQQ-binding-like beta-propeller repeat protein [Stappia albiluteola]